ncbi:FecR family protein [Chitinophaga rhizophila]|uniref:FecR domain-containing protein n=1 Tax=Chitinophaga rhizophila TaxID=2866212 RepID=A0ABS7GH65_9BACT|nr:FecR family protein [Chitinophaga rhizophila]MBW8687039.1 FecR domain-containing protein [Chitinophaga rhizophila]
MPDHQQRIAYLLARYVNKTCSREELEELFAMIGQENGPDIPGDLLEEIWHTAHPAPDIDYEQAYLHIKPVVPIRRSLPFRKIAVAASVLLLAGAGYWWLSAEKKTAQITTVQSAPAPPILPAGNKAVLTLADGSTVTLDSAGNQVISQGKVAIRQSNGQLLYAGQPTDGSIHYNKLTTPRGGQFRLVLPDGTKVWLNSASMLRYPTVFSGKERIVELDGQGYFEVAPDAQHPFKVKVHDIEVQVLGTTFDIMAYRDEQSVNTTLLTGSIRVNKGSVQQLLQPGQQAVANNQDQQLAVRAADLRKVTAWKNGMFVFNDMALPAILREVARWYDVDIVYNTSPATELYGGGIGRDLQLADVLALLEGNGLNHFRIEGRKVIVLP